MKISELIVTFERWANPSWQEKWDNCGWQVEPGVLDETAGVLVCLTPTLAVMKEAIALQTQGAPVNLILAHHPLIFGGLSAVVAGDSVGDMVRQAIAHRIGIYSAHTNFDQVENGTADVLAQRLQLRDVTPVEPLDAIAPQPEAAKGGSKEYTRGYGRVGNLPIVQPLQQLLETIQSVLAPPRLLYSPAADLQQPIERVAVLGGSGAGYLKAVAKTGAQAYLTADCKFHQFQESRDRNIVLIDAGHYATERPACAQLVTWLQQQGVEWAQLSEKDEDFRQFL
jgi:dinuclear metal center YbgI/SA1388 family protein